MRNKLLPILLIIPFLISIITLTKAQADEIPSTFKDVTKDHWAYDAIEELVKLGYIKVENEYFHPNEAITREQAIEIIAYSINEHDTETAFKVHFKDIDKERASYNAIRRLTELQLIQNSEYFRGNEALTRAQITKILTLAYGFDYDDRNRSTFTDVPKTHWAHDMINSLVDNGIIQGVGDKRFAPNKFVTRAQLASMVVKSLAFKQRIDNLEVAYDYLAKEYIDTANLYKQWSLEVADLVNKERAKVGLVPLEYDYALEQQAIIKAHDMVDRIYFEHYSPFYGNPWDQAMLFDYVYITYGENIARFFNGPELVMFGWMRSQGHRENILNLYYTHIGVGVAQDSSGQYYWVQHFSSK